MTKPASPNAAPKKPDLRQRLTAIAAGKAPVSGQGVIDGAFVDAHQAEFAAWEGFVRVSCLGGEPLAAPSELLAPLP